MKIEYQFNFKFVINGSDYNFNIVSENEEMAKKKLNHELNQIINQLNA